MEITLLPCIQSDVSSRNNPPGRGILWLYRSALTIAANILDAGSFTDTVLFAGIIRQVEAAFGRFVMSDSHSSTWYTE